MNQEIHVYHNINSSYHLEYLYIQSLLRLHKKLGVNEIHRSSGE